MDTRRLRGFTLVELMIVIAVISILVSMVTPVLTWARSGARMVQCSGNLRQLGTAWALYADDYRGLCMPQVWFTAKPDPIYWWGADTDPPDYSQGLVHPYLGGEGEDTAPGEHRDDVFDCPEQPWGTYVPQGDGRHPTTTYGYNALYVCPFHSGWEFSLIDFATGAPSVNARWRTRDEIQAPSQVFIFADTLLDLGSYHKNCCLLDGPQTPSGGGSWSDNRYPTLCFRHRGRACIAFADNHVESVHEGQATLTSPALHIGCVGKTSGPHYVPDWADW